jgi:hypothetical protein
MIFGFGEISHPAAKRPAFGRQRREFEGAGIGSQRGGITDFAQHVGAGGVEQVIVVHEVGVHVRRQMLQTRGGTRGLSGGGLDEVNDRSFGASPPLIAPADVVGPITGRVDLTIRAMLKRGEGPGTRLGGAYRAELSST